MRKILPLVLLISAFTFTGLLLPGDKNQELVYESLDTLAEILTVVQENAASDVDGSEMVEGAISGLLGQLDPHSSYYNEIRYQMMREDQKGRFYGIGIIVGYQNDKLTVISPMDGAPAASAGIRAGDVISRIDGKSTEGLDFFDAIRLLRGDKNSLVSVTVVRKGLDQPITVKLRRAEIPSDNVRTSFMLDEKTGYVALRDFGETATDEVASAIVTLQAQNMQQLVLDLRGNPGGLLPQAIGISSLFIPGRKLVVSTQGRMQSSSQEYYSEKTSPIEALPLVVLIDRGSASASEIVAGAIQDHDRGLIVGNNSWGKGLVQSVFPLDKGNKGLALTTSRYYTPSGRNIQGSYESLEAYYNPDSAENEYFEPSNDKDKIFKTVHGRQVHEVRGITPDVYISSDDAPELIDKLQIKYSAFFNFATVNQESFGEINPEWRVDDRVYDAFKDWLASESIAAEGLDDHRHWVDRKLTYQFLNIKNDDWSWEYLMKGDRQVRAALELFGNAAELLAVYRGERNIRSEYTTELRSFAVNHKEQNSDAKVSKQDP